MYNSTAVGWSQLMNADLINAVYTMFAFTWGGWFIAILYFTYQIILWIKTKNMALLWITGTLFLVLYYNSPLVKDAAFPVMILVWAIELGVVIYTWVWK